MSFWEGGGSAEKLGNDSVSDFRTQFRPWQEDVKVYLQMIDPQPTGRNADLWLHGQERAEADRVRAANAENVSSRVAGIYANVVGRVAKSPPRIRVAVRAPEAEQKDKQAMMLRWARGLLNEQDYLTQYYGLGTSFARRMASYAASMGKVVEFINVTESLTKSGEAVVDWQLFDPLQCYHTIGASWPRRFLRHYQAGTGDVQKDLDDLGIAGVTIDATKKLHEVAVFWVEEVVRGRGFEVSWAITVDEKLVADPKETKLKRMPNFVLTANSSPTFSTFTQTYPSGNDRALTVDAIRHHARAMYANLRHTHFQSQEYTSLLMDGLAWAANPVKTIISPDGSVTLNAQQLGPGATLSMTPEVVVKFLETSVRGMEVASVLEKVFEAEYVREYNPVLFGESFPGDSGYKDYLKGNSAGIQLQETSRCAGVAHELGVMEITQRVRDLGLNMTLESHRITGMEAGHFIAETFKATDFPEQFIIDIQMAPDVPKDDAAAFAVARQALDLGMSLETVFSDMLHVENATTEIERRQEQDIQQSPQMQQRKIGLALVNEWIRLAAAAKRAKNPDRKQAIQALAESARNDLRLLQAQLAGGAPPAPTQPLNPRVEVMPAQQGAKNPQLAAEAVGAPGSSTGTNGRPPTNGTGPGAL